MAVDYASKTWERNREGWALRNVKLRMSRKLLYVKGLLVCFDYGLSHAEERAETPVLDGTVEELSALLSPSPIECLAGFAVKHELKQVAIELLDQYNFFLSLMAENGNRKHLKRLTYEEASNDELFGEFRTISQKFQLCLIEFFFSTNERLTKMTQEYGLF